MPHYITDEKGNKIRVFTYQDVLDAHRRGFEDSGKKNYSAGQYTEEDLKNVFQKGSEQADRLVSAAARAGYEEGFQEGEKVGRQKETAKIEELKQNAEKRGYTSGFQDAARVNQEKFFRQGYEKGQQDLRRNLPQPRMRSNINILFPIQPIPLLKSGIRALPKSKATLYIGMPLAAGFFCKLSVTKLWERAKDEANIINNKKSF